MTVLTEQVSTDFVLKDERDYVHSTTLSELMCELALRRLPKNIAWSSQRLDAKFHRMIYGNGCFMVGDQALVLDNNRASVVFKIHGDGHELYGTFYENEGSRIEKRIRSTPVIEELCLTGDFSGTCRIASDSLAALLENVIEANKRVHIVTLNHPRPPSVLNVFMRGFPVGLEVPAGRKPLLRIRNISARHKEGAVATLNSVTLPEIDEQPFELSYLATKR